VADTDVEVRVSKPSDRRDVQNRSPSNAVAPATSGVSGGSKSADLADRRRHPRYRFSEPVKVCCQDGACLDGMSVELSQSGMSAMIQGPLKPGDVVRLQPVTGVITDAVVRHKLGMLYGFEFLELACEQAGKIADRCRKCEPWRSNARGV
jgi:PilZ domain-containing protein